MKHRKQILIVALLAVQMFGLFWVDHSFRQEIEEGAEDSRRRLSVEGTQPEKAEAIVGAIKASQRDVAYHIFNVGLNIIGINVFIIMLLIRREKQANL
jgi:hypothetical protein